MYFVYIIALVSWGYPFLEEIPAYVNFMFEMIQSLYVREIKVTFLLCPKTFLLPYDMLSLTHFAVVHNEAKACFNSYGRQPLFYKVQALLQGNTWLHLFFCCISRVEFYKCATECRWLLFHENIFYWVA